MPPGVVHSLQLPIFLEDSPTIILLQCPMKFFFICPRLRQIYATRATTNHLLPCLWFKTTNSPSISSLLLRPLQLLPIEILLENEKETSIASVGNSSNTKRIATITTPTTPNCCAKRVRKIITCLLPAAILSKTHRHPFRFRQCSWDVPRELRLHHWERYQLRQALQLAHNSFCLQPRIILLKK